MILFDVESDAFDGLSAAFISIGHKGCGMLLLRKNCCALHIKMFMGFYFYQ